MLKWAGHRRLAAMRKAELPTPLASDHKGAAKRSESGRRQGGPRLTPELAQARGYLPTPTVVAYTWQQGGSQGRTGPKRPSVDTLAKHHGLGRSFLTLREWMMGWPLGWSASEPLGTDKFLEWLRSHGGC